MVARLDKIKDQRTVIRALAEATLRRPDIVIEFAGDGPLLEELRREAAALKVGGRVRFLGFRPVGSLLAQWDIYVHSTTESEGMGTALAEAMMAGLPCLVSDLSVMREVCGPEGAVYVQAGNASSLARALIELVEDRAMREAFGHAAQNRARRLFGLSRAASAYVNAAFPGTSHGTR
jgi:glycosyltransferase involved in cell wall biosynthesis